MIKKILFFAIILIACIAAFNNNTKTSDANSDINYAIADNWVYLETDINEDKPVDVFFVSPTAYNSADPLNMDLNNTSAKASTLGAVNKERGIYDKNARFFSPYYNMVSMRVYALNEADRIPYLDKAYEGVKAAFAYYLANYNNGRPIILAGFSQGADHITRLLKDFFSDETLQSQLVAAYAIGWRVTDKDLADYPHLKMAEGEDDFGVIISFNSEAPHVNSSLMIPKDVKTHPINPLNWRTDSTPADKSLNSGACFTDYDGNILIEVPELTGAYIDEVRGALKVTDVAPDNISNLPLSHPIYPIVVPLLGDGVYHPCDFQFFYRNLQDNVAKRINSYLNFYEGGGRRDEG